MKNLSDLSDEDLIEMHRQGDFEAVEILCKRYQNLVGTYAKRFFIKGGEEQDVIQEGMLGLFKAIEDFDEKKGVPFSSFAKTCISRQIFKAMEAAERKKNQPLNSYISIYEDDNKDQSNQTLIEEILADDIANPENLLLDSEKTKLIMSDIIKCLSKMELEVFFYMMQGYDYKNIAKKMDLTEKKIDNAMQRIRKKVRKIYIDS